MQKKKKNKTHFRRIQTSIQKIENELFEIQCEPTNLYNQEREKLLQFNLQKEMKNEETLWHQNFRIAWLTSLDLNTKFFHLSATIRKRSNAIDSIKLGLGIWTMDPIVSESTFIDYFRSIYTSSNPQIQEQLENLFEKQVSDQDNELLGAMPSKEETFGALNKFQITKHQALMVWQHSSTGIIGVS